MTVNAGLSFPPPPLKKKEIKKNALKSIPSAKTFRILKSAVDVRYCIVILGEKPIHHGGYWFYISLSKVPETGAYKQEMIFIVHF